MEGHYHSSFAHDRCREKILCLDDLRDSTIHLPMVYEYTDLFQVLSYLVLEYIYLSLSLFLVSKSVPSSYESN